MSAWPCVIFPDGVSDEGSHDHVEILFIHASSHACSQPNRKVSENQYFAPFDACKSLTLGEGSLECGEVVEGEVTLAVFVDVLEDLEEFVDHLRGIQQVKTRRLRLVSKNKTHLFY